MQSTLSGVRIEPLSAAEFASARGELVELLRACVHGGASLGFMEPLPDSTAVEFWSSIGQQIESGSRLVLVARENGRIVGSGQLAFPWFPNGRHRAEVCKLMVLPSHRRRGIAAGIMSELERHARERNLRLLHLDTTEGASGACKFYESLGYTRGGQIPDWALDPDGTPATTVIYFKILAAADRT